MGVRQARALVNGAVTEKEFQQAVVQYAALRGWRTYHTYDSRRSDPGFPDLVMTRRGALIFAELKSERGVVSAAQAEWLIALGAVSALIEDCAGPSDASQEFAARAFQVFTWLPSDWPSIEDVLR